MSAVDAKKGMPLIWKLILLAGGVCALGYGVAQLFSEGGQSINPYEGFG